MKKSILFSLIAILCTCFAFATPKPICQFEKAELVQEDLTICFDAVSDFDFEALSVAEQTEATQDISTRYFAVVNDLNEDGVFDNVERIQRINQVFYFGDKTLQRGITIDKYLTEETIDRWTVFRKMYMSNVSPSVYFDALYDVVFFPVSETRLYVYYNKKIDLFDLVDIGLFLDRV